MVCKSLVQMQRIAAAGARKMNSLTHTVRESSYKALRGKQYRVKNVDNDVVYIVSVDSAKVFCQCAFYQENRPTFGADTTCKHLVYCQEIAAEAADFEAYAAERAENQTIHAMYSEIVQNGGGLGLPVVGHVTAGAPAGYWIEGDSRYAKMYAADADTIEAQLV